MSVGRMSGVNWIRLKLPSIEAATKRAARVLPTPGRSLSSTWPPASRLTTMERMASGGATIAPETLRSSASASWTRDLVSDISCFCTFEQILGKGPNR